MALPDETKTWVYIGTGRTGNRWFRCRNAVGELCFTALFSGEDPETSPLLCDPAKALSARLREDPLSALSASYDRLLALGWVEVDRNETHVLYEAADSEVDDSEPWELGMMPTREAGTCGPSLRGHWILGKSGWWTRFGHSGASYIPRDEPAKAPECAATCEACGAEVDKRDLTQNRYEFANGLICEACCCSGSRDYATWRNEMLARIAARRAKTSTPSAGLDIGCAPYGSRIEPRCPCGASLATNLAYAGKCADCYHNFNDPLKRPRAFPEVTRSLALSEQQQPREWWSARRGGRRRL